MPMTTPCRAHVEKLKVTLQTIRDMVGDRRAYSVPLSSEDHPWHGVVTDLVAIIAEREVAISSKAETHSVILVQAEHPKVPGIVTEIFSAEEPAYAEAMALVNCMLADSGRAQSANASNWPSKLEELQQEHGAEHCWVEVRRLPILTGKQPPSVPLAAVSAAPPNTASN